MTRILVADNDASTRRLLESMLIKWGYEGVGVKDGREAWKILRQRDSSPPLAILDWMMPGIDGVTLCRKVREIPRDPPTYLILLTAKGEKENIVEGLQKGANDYVTKPFDSDELHARIEVGIRMVQLQTTLSERLMLLEEALGHARQLRGLLRICSYCKKICDDEEQWQLMELYITEHSEAEFSHGVCPECKEKIVEPELAQLMGERKKHLPGVNLGEDK
jgi:phosphoserine phosphatase RsbU/P